MKSAEEWVKEFSYETVEVPTENQVLRIQREVLLSIADELEAIHVTPDECLADMRYVNKHIKNKANALIALLAVLTLCSCQSYKDSKFTPDSFGYTISVDRHLKDPVHYFGFNWSLKQP